MKKIPTHKMDATDQQQQGEIDYIKKMLSVIVWCFFISSVVHVSVVLMITRTAIPGHVDRK